MKRKETYSEILDVLKELKKTHPVYTMGQHLATATDGDTWAMTDKELLSALNSYKEELEYDNGGCEDIDKIIKEGSDLSSLFDKDDEYGDEEE